MAFGELSETQIKEVEEIQYQLLVAYEQFSVFGTWPRLGKLLLRNRWKKYLQFLKNQDDVILPLIRARKKLRQERGKAFELISYTDSLLDLKISEEKGNLEEADVLSLCSEFINAGADTSTTMLQWVLAYLVKHPRIQSKLFAEISEVVAKGAKEVEEDDLHKIPYLKAVVLESLRIHPPNTSLIPHTVMEDVELCGYTIPKDTTVNIVTALIGRDPNVWENPMEFRPERLLTGEDIGEEVSDVTAFKMMPFGAGRRMCPGNRLGLLLLQYLVSNLVWNFEFKTVDGEGVDLSEKEEFLVVMKNPGLPFCKFFKWVDGTLDIEQELHQIKNELLRKDEELKRILDDIQQREIKFRKRADAIEKLLSNILEEVQKELVLLKQEAEN
ncbi:cytochrome P450 89A2-like [Carya illinoinensis]|uniref:cytochrome P450 89A2-like n=1 Tax=Carya illinoinensis TaxID=32201 RepID=UPI001C7251B2|nr:cytochrome P450 89A2-like [Carya illinoinensis]